MATFDLLAWGANSHCQLGHGVESEQCVLPRIVELNDIQLEPAHIMKITGGAGHSLILDVKGQVYSCGWNSKGQTGIIGEDTITKFRRIEHLKDESIVDIACGWDSSMALAKNGTVFAWGSNNFGQLGKTSQQLGYSSVVFKVPIGERVTGISLGLRHSALATESGKVFVAGAGNKCQLGLIDSENKAIRGVHTFTEVPGLSDVKMVSCGQHHTVALTKNGDLYSWGDNKHGQLGVDSTLHPSVLTPLKLQDIDLGPSLKIYTGWTHTVVLNEDGKILAWGRNTYGQLGCEEFHKPVPWRPDYIQNVLNFRQFSVGSEHNIALADDGTIMSWGWNEHGNCGNGTEYDVFVPMPVAVPSESIGTLIGTGAGHSFAVVQK